MKQAVATGWNCTRAKILVKLRENMSEDFQIQTIGRIRRMPESKFYEKELFDNCYLYTFDEEYKETCFNDTVNKEIERFDWVNNYPRKIHGHHLARKMFEEKVRKFS